MLSYILYRILLHGLEVHVDTEYMYRKVGIINTPGRKLFARHIGIVFVRLLFKDKPKCYTVLQKIQLEFTGVLGRPRQSYGTTCSHYRKLPVLDKLMGLWCINDVDGFCFLSV